MAQKDQNEKIALFKYGIIAPVIHDTAKRQTDYFKDIAQKIFDVPDIGRRTYCWRTFKTWLRDYRLHGFDGLKPKGRTDKGASRKMDTALALVIKEKFETFPQINISVLYRMLAAEGYINGGSPCQETVRRFIRNHDLKPKTEPLTPRKKFEKPHINELWLADFMHGMPLLIDNKKRRPFLCGMIDDHSRLMVGFRWTLSETTQTLELVLKEAILTYGLPKVFYCDNGAAFSSTHLQLVCARLNIALVHSKPYDSPARGKIERFWRTVRQGFLAILPQNENHSLEQFNQSFAHWIDAHYHRVIHHTTAQTPLERYLDDLKMTQVKRVEQHQLDLIFYQTVIRKVKNDATISLNGQLFEVPQQYIGNKIELRHPTGQPLDLWIYEQDKPVCKIKKLDPVFNSQNAVSAIRFSKKEDRDA
jgi:transposase InsO family protein